MPDAEPSNMPRLPMVLLAVVAHGLLSVFAYAPFDQFYLAWVAVIPLLWLSATATTPLRAFGRGYLAGFTYFCGNLWYLWFIGFWPMLGTFVYLALFNGLFAVAWRPWAQRSSVLVTGLMAAVMWVAVDYLRAMLPFGLPYIFLGHTQLPLLPAVQIADTLGAYGVTFLVVLVNASIYFAWKHRRQAKPTGLLSVTTGVIVACTAYGFLRLGEQDFTEGPQIALVQPDLPLLNTEPPDDVALMAWLIDASRDAADASELDLVVWPESSTPAINVESRRFGLGGDYGSLIAVTHGAISSISAGGPDFLVGGSYRLWEVDEDRLVQAVDRRNAVYHYAEGQQSQDRYDKRALMPFGEYIPLSSAPPPLSFVYDFFNLFNPWGGDYSLTPGKREVVFDINGTRAVTPICFEDILPWRTREMVYQDGFKAADLIVNVTNDGWFRGNQMAQHLQAAAFRSIENRVPMVRSVNTGVSAFVDPDGRIASQLPAAEAGVLVGRPMFDTRTSPYGRIGDAFAVICSTLSVIGIIGLRLKTRKKTLA